MWAYGTLATGLGVTAVLPPLLLGRAGLGGLLVLAPVAWLALMAWGHGMLRIEVGQVGMRLRVPDQRFGLLLPPLSDLRFTWSEVEAVTLIEGARGACHEAISRPGAPSHRLIVRAKGQSVTLGLGLIGAQMLDIAELVAVASNHAVDSGEPFAPGGR
ncbi:hypothetical protein F11_11595 [Rhodospirillum rubrum F11]|nr:hypothetical protein F11_11595 [Rhodospirillum rubrum F11]